MNVSHVVVSSVSECNQNEEWYDCEPCKELRCGDPHPWLCLSNFGVCKKPGCYCKEPFLWNSNNTCVHEEDCDDQPSEESNEYDDNDQNNNETCDYPL